jgi:hypothetical protein
MVMNTDTWRPLPPDMIPRIANLPVYYHYEPADWVMKLTTGFNYTPECFRIEGPGGSRLLGYFAGYDFPGESNEPLRGAIFSVESGSIKNQGLGLVMTELALRLMAEVGTQTVTMTVVHSPGGKKMLARLIARGVLSPAIKVHDETSEHLIMIL